MKEVGLSEAPAGLASDAAGVGHLAAVEGGRYGGRRRRIDAGSVRVTERDVELLRLVGEMYAVSQTQLRRLLGCSESRAHRVRRRWQRAGWVEAQLMLAAEPLALWPTREGLRVAGLGEYRVWRPSPQRIGHVLALADVRLLVEERRRGARWVSERQLARDGGRAGRTVGSEVGQHRPDGVVELDGRRAAVELELTSTGRERARQIMRLLLEHFDSAWYFAAPRPAAVISEAAERLGTRERVRIYSRAGDLLWPLEGETTAHGRRVTTAVSAPRDPIERGSAIRPERPARGQRSRGRLRDSGL